MAHAADELFGKIHRAARRYVWRSHDPLAKAWPACTDQNSSQHPPKVLQQSSYASSHSSANARMMNSLKGADTDRIKDGNVAQHHDVPLSVKNSSLAPPGCCRSHTAASNSLCFSACIAQSMANVSPSRHKHPSSKTQPHQHKWRVRKAIHLRGKEQY